MQVCLIIEHWEAGTVIDVIQSKLKQKDFELQTLDTEECFMCEHVIQEVNSQVQSAENIIDQIDEKVDLYFKTSHFN